MYKDITGTKMRMVIKECCSRADFLVVFYAGMIWEKKDTTTARLWTGHADNRENWGAKLALACI